jgi:dsRNA-specific ribonuclease
MDIQNRTFELDNITVNAEVFEALFGAVYLKRGIEVARRVALKHIFKIELPFDSLE